jgi:hypothetical protein
MSRWQIRRKTSPVIGPFSHEEVVEAIRIGKVPFDSLVCVAGSEEWQPVASVPAFRRLFIAPTPPTATPNGAVPPQSVTGGDSATKTGTRMALINCPDCGRQCSSEAPSCPGCGRPIAPVRSQPQPPPQPQQYYPPQHIIVNQTKSSSGCGTFIMIVLAVIVGIVIFYVAG